MDYQTWKFYMVAKIYTCHLQNSHTDDIHVVGEWMVRGNKRRSSIATHKE